MKPDTRNIVLENTTFIPELFGSQDLNLKLIEKKFNVRITTRENHIKIKGDPEDVETVENLFMQMEKLHEANLPIENGDVKFAIRLISEDSQADLKAIFSERIAVSPKKGYITPKGPAQH
ncbi:MAG: PhoH family protein, partial [Nitrospina sp.]|nr:PhoH family protein [Nitrospina sp.]